MVLFFGLARNERMSCASPNESAKRERQTKVLLFRMCARDNRVRACAIPIRNGSNLILLWSVISLSSSKGDAVTAASPLMTHEHAEGARSCSLPHGFS